MSLSYYERTRIRHAMLKSSPRALLGALDLSNSLEELAFYNFLQQGTVPGDLAEKYGLLDLCVYPKCQNMSGVTRLEAEVFKWLISPELPRKGFKQSQCAVRLAFKEAQESWKAHQPKLPELHEWAAACYGKLKNIVDELQAPATTFVDRAEGKKPKVPGAEMKDAALINSLQMMEKNLDILRQQAETPGLAQTFCKKFTASVKAFEPEVHSVASLARQ